MEIDKLQIITNLYWIRHAFSCANILQHKGFISNIIRPIITIDPALTTSGVEQAKELNKYLLSDQIKTTFNVILCSNLKRAMETAMYAFDNKNSEIYVVPYISEARNPFAFTLNIDKENAPLTAIELETYYKKISNQFNIKVNFTIIKELDPNGKEGPNYDKFIKNVLPKIVGPDYNIAIISHSHFIRDHLSKINPNIKLVQNTEMWMERVELEMIKSISKYKKIDIPECAISKGICRLYEGKPTPTNLNDERCESKQNSKLYSFALGNQTKTVPGMVGGSNDNDYEKYLKYKAKYFVLKEEYDRMQK